MIRSIKYGLLFVLGLVIVSCSKDKGELAVELPKKKDAELIAALDTLSTVSYSYFYTKLGTHYQDSAQNVSFKTSLRIVSDSASQFLITYATIPIVNALITKDSVKVSNRRDECYVLQSLDYIKETFAVDFTLRDIENLLMGIPVNFNIENKYHQIDDRGGYTLCSHNRRQLKKVDKGEIDEIVMYYTLASDLSYLMSTTVVSPKDSTEIRIDYKTREIIDNHLLPKEVVVVISTPKQTITIELDYKKTRINEREQIYFVIPEGYVECE